MKTLRLPEGNRKDVAELPEPAKKGLKIYPHKHIDEIVKILFKVPKVAKAASDNAAEKVAKKTDSKK